MRQCLTCDKLAIGCCPCGQGTYCSRKCRKRDKPNHWSLCLRNPINHGILKDPWILLQISLVDLETFLLIRSTFVLFYRKTLPSKRGDTYYSLLYEKYGSLNIRYLSMFGLLDGLMWYLANPLKLKNLNHKLSWIQDALSVACERGHLPIVRYLCENPHDLQILQQLDASSPHIIIRACANGHLDVVRYLCENPENIWALRRIDASSRGNDAICQTCQNGHLPVVRYLCENPANVKALKKIDASAEYNYAIRFACYNGHLPVVRYLCENPMNVKALRRVDASDLYNFAITHAITRAHLDIVRYLSTNPLHLKSLENVDPSAYYKYESIKWMLDLQ